MSALKRIRQERFAQLYVELGNATEAYRQAGYQDHPDVDSNAHRLTVNDRVAVRIAEIRRENEAKSGFDREKAIELLAEIARHGEKDSDRVAAIAKIGAWSGWDQPQRIVVSADPFSDYLQEMRRVPLLRDGKRNGFDHFRAPRTD
jgi:phage terminase small subunit